MLLLRQRSRLPCLLHNGARFLGSDCKRGQVDSGIRGAITFQHEVRRGKHHDHHQQQDFGSRLSRPLPQGTWDSHMHVVDPTRFPLDARAQYTPPPHTLADARAYYAQFDRPIENMVLVQPSIYGNDNSCMLEALRELTPQHGRAIVGLDPTTSTSTSIDKDRDRDRETLLREWHELGVRGARVNLVSVGRDVSESELRTELEAYANVLRPLDWVLTLYIPLKLAVPLEKVVPDLGVRVCIDHFGWPTLPESESYDPYALTGFASLINLLKQGGTWVKLSAPYRLSRDPDMRDLDPIGRELVLQGPDRVVYATDWPHTRFDHIDPVPFIEKCFQWCGADNALVDKLFRTNAEHLWDVTGSHVTSGGRA